MRKKKMSSYLGINPHLCSTGKPARHSLGRHHSSETPSILNEITQGEIARFCRWHRRGAFRVSSSLQPGCDWPGQKITPEHSRLGHWAQSPTLAIDSLLPPACSALQAGGTPIPGPQTQGLREFAVLLPGARGAREEVGSRKARTTKGSRWPGLPCHQASWPPLLFIHRELGPFKELRLHLSSDPISPGQADQK